MYYILYCILELMCANLLYTCTLYIHVVCLRLCVRIEWHFSLGSLLLLIITYYPPHVHHCSILPDRHLFSAQILRSSTLSLHLSLYLYVYLLVYFSFVCIYWILQFNVKLFFRLLFGFVCHRTAIACSYLQVPYSTRIIDEFSLIIVSVRLVWLSFFLLCATECLQLRDRVS